MAHFRRLRHITSQDLPAVCGSNELDPSPSLLLMPMSDSLPRIRTTGAAAAAATGVEAEEAEGAAAAPAPEAVGATAPLSGGAWATAELLSLPVAAGAPSPDEPSLDTTSPPPAAETAPDDTGLSASRLPAVSELSAEVDGLPAAGDEEGGMPLLLVAIVEVAA